AQAGKGHEAHEQLEGGVAVVGKQQPAEQHSQPQAQSQQQQQNPGAQAQQAVVQPQCLTGRQRCGRLLDQDPDAALVHVLQHLAGLLALQAPGRVEPAQQHQYKAAQAQPAQQLPVFDGGVAAGFQPGQSGGLGSGQGSGGLIEAQQARAVVIGQPQAVGEPGHGQRV